MFKVGLRALIILLVLWVRPMVAQEVPKPYSVQVGAFESIDEANDMVEQVKSYGHSKIRVIDGLSKSDTKLYRVLVGSFSTEAEARKTHAKLLSQNVKSFIKRTDKALYGCTDLSCEPQGAICAD